MHAPAAPTGPSVSAVAALVLGAVAMGISPVFVRFADVGPFASAFWRVALALPVLWLWMAYEERGGVTGTRWSRAALLAGVAFTGDLLFWHLSILRTSVANATFFATTAPVFVVLFGWVLLGTRPGRSVVAGLTLCLAGGAGLVAQSLSFNPAHVAGDLEGIATAVFFGLYFLAVSAARRSAGPARVTFEFSCVTAASLLCVALASEPRLWPTTGRGATSLFAMAWISQAGGQGLLSIALGRLPAVFSSLVIFLEAIAAAGFGYAFLGEPVTLVQALGGLAILAGIWVARPKAPSAVLARTKTPGEQTRP